MSILLFVVGAVTGGMLGIFIESKSAQNDIKKVKKELKSRDNIITSLTKEVLYLKERR
jgi:uncharacterized protein YneF (UPF0154 family)